MRVRLALYIALLQAPGTLALASQADKPATRYGVPANVRTYSQETPKDALASVLLAMDKNRIDYLLAQLTDPEFVDKRVKEVYGGKFDEFVAETSMKLADNPDTIKELRRFLKEGEWDETGTTAAVKLKDVKDRQVFLRKVGERWFLENRQKPQ
jgi:hypothetical protein